MDLIHFMSTTVGRALRVLVGVVLIVVGVAAGGGWLGLSVIGLVPLFAGVLNICLLAPIVGQPIKGH